MSALLSHSRASASSPSSHSSSWGPRSASASVSLWKPVPVNVRWFPARTGWGALVTREGFPARMFVLRSVARNLFVVREVCGSDVYDMGLAFGMEHARRKIQRWLIEFPEAD